MNSNNILSIFILSVLIAGCNKAVESEKLRMDNALLNTCDSLSTKAIHDYNDGIKNYTVLGTVEADNFEMFYSNYMEKNYKITLFANCSPDFPERCYQTTMNSKVEQEYGVDFMKTTREKAMIEFKISASKTQEN